MKINLLDGIGKNNIYDYDTIIRIVPYYDEIKAYLENIRIISEQEVMEWSKNHYTNSIAYSKLKEELLDEEEIKKQILNHTQLRYRMFQKFLSPMQNSAKECCDLIEYIGHYPTKYPVPTEEEKNTELEKLLEQYDIIVRYYAGDLTKMQIDGDTIIRTVTHLNYCLEYIKKLTASINNKDAYLKTYFTSENYKVGLEDIISKATFPLSSYQEEGKSRREEGKRYLRLQHGPHII